MCVRVRVCVCVCVCVCLLECNCMFKEGSNETSFLSSSFSCRCFIQTILSPSMRAVLDLDLQGVW